VFIYSSCGRWVFPPSCGVFFPLPLLQAFMLLITVQCCCSCQPPCLFTAHVGSGSSPLSCGVFLPPSLSQAFSLLVAGCVPPLPPEPLWPARPGLFTYSSGKDSLPLIFGTQGTPMLFPTCLYCSYCLLLSVSFFPRWRSVCPGCYAGLAQGCLVPLSSPCPHFPLAIWAQETGSPGALLVSPCNVKWRCSVLAGGVEGSKFCFFSVVLPARCVSSISPRFHCRRHAFCFLPVAAILESSFLIIILSKK
jgi:hypothetical protein